MAIKIVTDSSCDLGINFIEENNIELIPLLLNLDGETLKDDLGKSLGYREFYEKLRAGSMPSTSQINIYTFEEKFKELLDKGYEILYIGLSSALSGTFNSANMARNNILEENPNAKIAVVDSISVSMGLGMLIKKACKMIEEGKMLEDIVQWIEENKNKVIHAILVDDLKHLKRGGRVSASTAAVGSILNIKPLLKLNNSGAVEASEKIKGKKKGLKRLASIIKENAINIENEILYIMHGDVLEEAQYLKEIILQELNFKDVKVEYIGTVIGTHGGPGTIATVFWGNER
nr:DegV family protein [uncultured Clostridium sp.]